MIDKWILISYVLILFVSYSNAPYLSFHIILEEENLLIPAMFQGLSMGFFSTEERGDFSWLHITTNAVFVFENFHLYDVSNFEEL